MSLKDLNARRKDLPPQENVAIQVAEYHIAVKGKQTPDQDYIEGYLMHDALGMTAEFDKNNAPTTLVKAKLRPVDSKNPKYARPEILDIQRGHGQAKPVQPGGVVVFEGSFIDRDGFVNSRWPRPAVYDMTTEKEHIFPGFFASVHPERRGQNEDYSYQHRFVADVGGAIAFQGVDGFRKAAAHALENGAGAPGFILRGADPEAKEVASTRWTRKGQSVERDGERSWELLPIEDVIKDFEAKRPEFMEHIANGEGLIWEIIPTSRFNTGKLSLPSAKTSGADDSEHYSVMVDGHRESAYTLSHVVVRSMDAESDHWFGTSALPTSRRPVLYLDSELPTENLPEELRTHLTTVASKRRTIRAGGAQEQGDDANFGEPDPMGEAQGHNLNP